MSSNDTLFLTLAIAFIAHIAMILSLNVNWAIPKRTATVVEISLLHPRLKPAAAKKTLPQPSAVPTSNTTKIVPDHAPATKPVHTHTHSKPLPSTTPNKPIKPRIRHEQVSTEPMYPPPPQAATVIAPEVVTPIVAQEQETKVIAPPTAPEPVITDPAPALPALEPVLLPPTEKPVSEQSVLEPVSEPVVSPQIQVPDISTEHVKSVSDKQPSHSTTTRKSKRRSKHAQKSAPSLNLDNLQAQISQAGEKFAHLSEPQSGNRVKSLSSVSKHQYLARQYIADWQRKVEKIGNLNYPQAAREKDFSATLVMEVGIKTDGSLDSMKIKKSSGNSEVDEAAKNIVQMSTPFAPLPRELENELDVLLIRRTWLFSDESGMSTH